MSHLSPSAIFSPTVARQQQAAAKDWSYIDAWLSRTFNTIGKGPPAFERNADTLKALLALAALNESADEDRELLSAVERKALVELQSKKEDENGEILQSLSDHLSRDGQAALTALSSASLATNLSSTSATSPSALLEKVLDLQHTSYDLAQASERISVLQAHLSREFSQISALIEELQGPAYQASSSGAKNTLEQQRKIKVLAAKLPELRDRVAALGAASSGAAKPTVQDLKVEEERYRELLGVVKVLESEVKGFHGLPHDVDLARLELEALRVELKGLMRERDRMFEGLVERESPRKAR